jgi:hypothetical protein
MSDLYVPVHSCNTTSRVHDRRLPLSPILSQRHVAPVPPVARLRCSTSTCARSSDRPASQLCTYAKGRTYNSSMITTSTSFTCPTFRSRLATVLDVSTTSTILKGTYLDLVTCDTTSETNQVVWAISTFMLVLFTACWTLAISDVSVRGAKNIRGYEDNLVDCAQDACSSCTFCSDPLMPRKSRHRPSRLEDRSTSEHPSQSASIPA